MAKNFSDNYLKNLKPKDKTYTVREGKGFTLKVWPAGTKTFLYIYEVAGKRKQLNLGTYPLVSLSDARKKYNDASEAVYNGDPVVPPVAETVAEVAADVTTVKELVQQYLNNAAKSDGATHFKIKKNCLEKKLSAWMTRPANSITKAEAIKLIEDEYKNGSGAARNLYRAARSVFEFALLRDIVIASPFDRMKKIIVSLKNPERARFLTEKEIQIVWKGITDGGGTAATKRAMKTILVTGQRPGEVAGMHRREIYGDWWTIPAERAEKGKRDHRVFLTATAKELIGDTEGFIFPSPMADSAAGHITRIAVAQQVRYSDMYGIPKWIPHDLRRTARTHMSRLRVPREVAEAVLNHAKGGMVKIYDQYEFDDEKKEALQAWERELLRLVTHSSTSV